MKALLICPGERPEVSVLSEWLPLSNIQVLGKTLLEYWIEDLVLRGAREIFVLATDRPEQVRALLGKGARWGVQITVFPEIRELTAGDARARYCEGPAAQWLPAPHDVVVMDHLPGLEQMPLFTSYAHWMAALQHELPRAATADRIGLREMQAGVWVGHHAEISPKAQLVAPCWIGEDVFIGDQAIVGPNVIVEKGSVIERGADLAESVVEADTFVGENTEVHHSIASGGLLVNWQLNSTVKISDQFLMCSLAAQKPHLRPVGVLSRAGAFLAMLVTAPLALFPILKQKLRGLPAFRPLLAVRPQPFGALPVTGDTMVYYELRNTQGWLRRWPQLWSIVRGQFAWVGNRPLNPKQASRLRNDFERLWLTTRLGLLCLADTESGCDLSREDARAHASYYAARAGLWLDWKIFLRAVFLFAFGLSVSRVKEACARLIQLVTERKAY